MNAKETGAGRPGSRLVYACSGCSDAGEIADQAARQLARDGIAEMSCIAGIGGLVKPLVVKAERAERILVIDGCPLTCARHSLERAGVSDFRHLNLVDLGLKKGRCPVTDETVARVADAAAKLLSEDARAA